MAGPPRAPCSNGVVADLAGADPLQPVEAVGPDLPVADLAGLGGAGDDLDRLVRVGRVDDQLDLDLGDEVDLVLRAPEGLGLAALAAVALDLTDGEAHEPGALDGELDVVQLERLDDCGHEMWHVLAPLRLGVFGRHGLRIAA